MHRRRYLMRHSALELCSDAGDIIMFNFVAKSERSRVRSWLKKKCSLEYRDRDHRRSAFKQMLHELQESWHRRDLSNFECARSDAWRALSGGRCRAVEL